ncbi:MAG: hypothetical protein ABI910_14960 [Gemmatimonadota bacterium]
MTEASQPSARGTPVAWFALLVAGQGATLALTQSGKGATYPHLQPDRFITGPYRLATLILVAQLALVAWGMRGRWSEAWRWLTRTIRAPWLAAGLMLLAALSAVASRDPRRFALELALSTIFQLLAACTVWLLVKALDAGATERAERWIARTFGDDGDSDPGRFFDPFAVRCALAVVLACAGLAWFVFQHMPHVPDEIVYLMQARYFAAGTLQLPAPPVAAAFDVDLMFYEPGRAFSPLPPGWPAILAIGVRLGVPWLVNPLLSGLCILLVHALMRRLDTVRTARIATLLLATSPWFLFLGMSLMTHSATLACALAAALGIAVARARSRVLPAAAAGIGVGVIGLIRPLEGLAVALVLGVWSLSASHKWFRLLPSAALTAVTTAVSALVLPYNAALTGSARRFPIMMYVDRYYAPGANDLGFGPNRGMGWGGLDPWPGHGWRDVLLNSLLNGAALNLEMFGWATGSLLLLVALVCSGRLRRLDWAMLGVIALVVGLHAFYWFGGGPDFAARYWFLIIIPCVALTARSPAALFGGGTPAATRTIVAMFALTAAAMLTWMPWRSVEKYRHFRNMSPAMREFVAAHPMDSSLVLVRGRRHPDYHEAALQNPLDLTRSPRAVFAWDRTAEVRRAAVAAYPTRQVYIIDGPTITGGGFRIVAGPLPPGSTAPELPSSADIPAVIGAERRDGTQQRTP